VKRFLKIVGVLILVLPLVLAGYIAYRLVPKELNLPLPESLIANNSPEGQGLLASAGSLADYPKLLEVWEGQELISYCGVASGVIVRNALGGSVDQISFFNGDTDVVRSRLQVTFGGMSLSDLAGLLAAHGMDVTKMHGDELTLEKFRLVVESNLAREEDYLLVNYQRQTLGQGRVGHISPLGAYDKSSDRVLIMDTADYKYPYTWVPLEALYAAMQEKDVSTASARGLIEVRLPVAARL
jgi:hypothetical protein